MEPKRSLVSVLCEATAMLLVTTAAFLWGRATAQIQRGCSAIGGESLLLLIPPIYYVRKRMILDWADDIREKRNTLRRR